MDPIPSACASGPMPNADISGIGVRLSFYAQVFVLGFICIASDGTETGFGALLTLAVTTLAYCVATLSLGFSAAPQISLYDAIIVLYLLEIASMSFAFPLVTAKKAAAARLVCMASIFGTIATELAILIAAPHFGSTPACNGQLVIGIPTAVDFFPVGRGLFIVYQAYKLGAAILFSWNGDHAARAAQVRQIAEGKPRWLRWVLEAGQDGFLDLVDREEWIHKRGRATNFLFFAALMTAFAEITRYVNHPQPEDRQWGFGQILPMCLIILPLKDAWMVLVDISRSRRRQPEERHHSELPVRSPRMHVREGEENGGFPASP